MDLPKRSPSREAPETDTWASGAHRADDGKTSAWPESMSLKFHSRTPMAATWRRNVCHKILISASLCGHKTNQRGTMERPLSWRTHGSPFGKVHSWPRSEEHTSELQSLRH